jgi:hypothetical protein
VSDIKGLKDRNRPMQNVKWWSRGESNPRPQVFAEQIYMRSCLIWVLKSLIAQQHAIKVPSHLF